MEGLLNLATDFVHDAGAVGRVLDVDRQREMRLAGLGDTLEQFARGDLALDELMRRTAAAVREQHVGRTGPVWLWGFKNEDERAFPERLAAAAARAPEVDLNGVLRSLLRDSETLTDDERVARLLAFADFVADLDSRGQEGDPRIGVGPSANFLTFCWHLLAQAREPVFLFETNKAIKAVSEASGDPELRGRDLEGRFRAFYLVARRLASALAPAPVPMRAGWALEHSLEWTLEKIAAVPQAPGGGEDPGTSGLWKPRPRAELRDRPPSGRSPAVTAAGGSATRPATRSNVTISPPRRPSSDERPIDKVPEPRVAEPAPAANVDVKIESLKTERIFAIGKARTIMHQDPVPERKEPASQEVQGTVTPRSLPRLVAKPQAPAEAAVAPRPAEPAPEPVRLPEPPRVPDPAPPPPEPARVVEARVLETPRVVVSARAEQARIETPPTGTPRPQSDALASGPKAAAPGVADAKATTAAQRRPVTDSSGELLTAALGELIGEIATAESEPEAAPAPGQGSGDTWRSERLSRDLGFADRVVSDALDSLATRGRLLLAGVVGTGKTYLARRIALHLAGRDERIVVLRMHPSLGYDELVEAQRPDGTIVRGVVRELCERARKERDARFALVLDDVDRGDFVRALGELAGAICERGVEIQLGRSRERIAAPKNLYVIATARSAPHELVGRFPTVEVEPDPEALRRFLARSHSALEWVADLLRETNARLVRDRGLHARLGQGLLMDQELDLARLEGIWRREVLPFVRSLGLDSKDFELSALRK